jgi:aldehyde:ferredoxin oxidoreductase
MSWARKLLRVDLTKGTCTSEPLNMEWAHEYLGQRGLATRYLTEEVDPKVDPLSPANELIFATGPLTGTTAGTAGRYSVITKGPLTGAIACSNSGGLFGAELKKAGWDLIIFQGRAPKPVYLYVKDGDARLLPATDLWGKTVWDTERWLRQQHKDAHLKVASIGGAGEQQVLYASVINDEYRAAGRSGVGAVMGSKQLKAVAVKGTSKVPARDPKAFREVAASTKKLLEEHPVTSQGLPTYGTNVLMNVINETGGLPTRNARDVQFEGAGNIGGEAMADVVRPDGQTNLVHAEPCFSCTIGCGRVSHIERTHFSVKDRPEYWGNSGGLEYESAWSMGAATGVDDLEALTFCNFLCNEHGMDTISFGSTVGAAMELFQIGAISEAQVGYPLRFGDARALVRITEETAKGIGFGKEIGLGSKRLCERYGHPELSMSVKGQEFPAYDARGIQGMGLEFATSNRGACHVRGYTVSSEVLGVPTKTDPLVSEGKAALVKAFQDLTAVVDSVGLCLFSTFAWGMPEISALLTADSEGDFSADTLGRIGERIWNLEREFNLAAGLTSKDDTLPKRLLKEAARTGPAKGLVSRLDVMLPEYYELRGWSAEGVPGPEILSRLGVKALYSASA